MNARKVSLISGDDNEDDVEDGDDEDDSKILISGTKVSVFLLAGLQSVFFGFLGNHLTNCIDEIEFLFG